MSKRIAESYLNIDKPEEPYIEQKEEITKKQNDYSADYSIIQDTVRNLFSEIKNSMNTGTPFFIFNIKRRNEKIRLNNEMQEMIYHQIKNLRAISKELLELRADDIFGPEYLKNLVEEKYELARQYFETIKEQHLTRIRSEQAKRGHIDFDLSDREISQLKEREILNKMKYETKQEKEKYKDLKFKNKESKVRIEMIKIAKGEMKFSDLPKSYQTFIWANILKADPDSLSKFDINERIKESVLQEAQAQADKKTAEAKAAEADTEMKNINNTMAKKDAGL